MKNNKFSQEVYKIKKRIVFSTCFIAILAALSVTAFAAESTPATASTPTAITSTTPASLTTSTSTPDAISTIPFTITLDTEDPAYPLAQMVEGITTTKSVNANGETEIVLSIPNNKLGEMSILLAKTKAQIIKNITDVCTEVFNDNGYDDASIMNNDSEEDYSATSYDTTQQVYIDTVEVITDTPSKVEFKITGLIPADIYDQLVQGVVDSVGKTLINQTSSVINSNISKAEKYLKNLKKSLKVVNKRHLIGNVKSIRAKIVQTTLYLSQLEDLKISVDTYKDDYFSTLDESQIENSNDDNDEGNGNNNNRDSDKNEKRHK